METKCTPSCYSPPGPSPAPVLLSVQAEMHEVLGRECPPIQQIDRHRHTQSHTPLDTQHRRRGSKATARPPRPVQLGSAGMPVPMGQKTNGPVTGNTLLPQNKLRLSDGYLAVGISRDEVASQRTVRHGAPRRYTASDVSHLACARLSHSYKYHKDTVRAARAHGTSGY